MTKFVVQRCVRSLEDVFRNVVGEFATEQDAQEFADAEDRCHPFSDVWFEVVEE